MGNKKRKKRSSGPKGPQTANSKLSRVDIANMNTSDDNTHLPVTLIAIWIPGGRGYRYMCYPPRGGVLTKV